MPITNFAKKAPRPIVAFHLFVHHIRYKERYIYIHVFIISSAINHFFFQRMWWIGTSAPPVKCTRDRATQEASNWDINFEGCIISGVRRGLKKGMGDTARRKPVKWVTAKYARKGSPGDCRPNRSHPWFWWNQAIQKSNMRKRERKHEQCRRVLNWVNMQNNMHVQNKECPEWGQRGGRGYFAHLDEIRHYN